MDAPPLDRVYHYSRLLGACAVAGGAESVSDEELQAALTAVDDMRKGDDDVSEQMSTEDDIPTLDVLVAEESSSARRFNDAPVVDSPSRATASVNEGFITPAHAGKVDMLIVPSAATVTWRDDSIEAASGAIGQLKIGEDHEDIRQSIGTSGDVSEQYAEKCSTPDMRSESGEAAIGAIDQLKIGEEDGRDDEEIRTSVGTSGDVSEQYAEKFRTPDSESGSVQSTDPAEASSALVSQAFLHETRRMMTRSMRKKQEGRATTGHVVGTASKVATTASEDSTAKRTRQAKSKPRTLSGLITNQAEASSALVSQAFLNETSGMMTRKMRRELEGTTTTGLVVGTAITAAADSTTKRTRQAISKPRKLKNQTASARKDVRMEPDGPTETPSTSRTQRQQTKNQAASARQDVKVEPHGPMETRSASRALRQPPKYK